MCDRIINERQYTLLIYEVMNTICDIMNIIFETMKIMYRNRTLLLRYLIHVADKIKQLYNTKRTPENKNFSLELSKNIILSTMKHT